MALAGLIPTFAVDVVGVFTSNFKQVFANARPIKAVIKDNSKLMQHPLENGSTTVDHRIFLPIEIELSMVFTPADYKNTYQQIKQLRQDGTLLTVQTRADSYTNQLIANIPHEEDTEMFDTITMGLSLQQVQFVTPQYDVVPKNPNNSTTVDRGTQQGQPANEVQQTAAQQGFNKTANLF